MTSLTARSKASEDYVNDQLAAERHLSSYSGIVLPCVALVLIAAAYTVTCYRTATLTIGGDYVVPLHAIDYLRRLWSDPTAILSLQPLPDILVFSMASLLGFNIYSANRLFVFLLVTLTAFSVYYLTVTLIPERLRLAGGVSAVLVYLYNPLVFSNTSNSLLAQFSTSQAGIFLVVAFMIRFFRTGRLRYTLCSGPATFLALGGHGISSYYNVFFWSGSFLFLLLYAVFHSGKLRALRRGLLYLGVAVPVSVLVNSYWVIPFLGVMPLYASFTSSFLPYYSLNDYSTMVNVLRMTSSWVLYSEYTPYGHAYLGDPLTQLSLIVYPVCAFSPLLFSKVVRSARYQSIYVISILTMISSTTYSPLVYLSDTHLGPYYFLKPFYSTGAVSASVLPILYAVLIGLLVCTVSSCPLHSMIERLASVKLRCGRRPVAFLLVLLIGAYSVTVSWPVTTGEVMRNWYSPTDYGTRIPSSYWDAKQFLEQASTAKDRALLLPPTDIYVGTSWGYQGAASFYNFMFNVPLITGHEVPYIGGYESNWLETLYRPPYEIRNANYPFDLLDQTARAASWGADNVTKNDGSVHMHFEPNRAGWHKVGLVLRTPASFRGLAQLVIELNGQLELPKLRIGIADLNGGSGWWIAAAHVYRLHNTTLVPAASQSAFDRNEFVLVLETYMPDLGNFSIDDVSSVWVSYLITDGSSGADVEISAAWAASLTPDFLYYGNLLASAGITYVIVDLAIRDGAKVSGEYWLAMLSGSSCFRLVWHADTLYIFRNSVAGSDATCD